MVFTAVDPAAPAIVETDTVQFDAVKLASQETVQFDAVSAVTEDTVQFKAVSLVSQDTVQFDAASANQDTIQFQAVSAPSEDVSMENTVVNLPIVSLADENEQNGEAIEVEESEPSSEETEMPNDVVEETEDLEQTTTFDAVSATENDLLSAVMKILETTPQENSSAHHRVFSDLTVSDDWSNHGNADEDNVGLIERNHAAGQTTEEDKR